MHARTVQLPLTATDFNGFVFTMS